MGAIIEQRDGYGWSAYDHSTSNTKTLYVSNHSFEPQYFYHVIRVYFSLNSTTSDDDVVEIYGTVEGTGKVQGQAMPSSTNTVKRELTGSDTSTPGQWGYQDIIYEGYATGDITLGISVTGGDNQYVFELSERGASIDTMRNGTGNFTKNDTTGSA